MHPSHSPDSRASTLPKVVETEEELAALRQHLHEVLEGAAFKGSHRCGQFLKYIVERAIAQRGDSLKERVIGIELFERPPSYDTGEDAIVRVTASDVRRRLLQHYGTYGSASDFRISLPQGAYVPEITKSSNGQKQAHGLVAAFRTVPATENAELSQDHPAQEPSAGVARPLAKAVESLRLGRVWLAVGLALTATNIVLAVVMFGLHRSPVGDSPRAVVPWSTFFSSARPAHLITSDPSITAFQDVCGRSITVSDYANHKFIPDASSLSPETLQFCRKLLAADDAASVDTVIAARIGELAQRASAAISVRAARNIELNDLKTDDNYILLGSPRSNPWSALFNDQLDFQFAYDKASNQEIVRNVRPRAHELSQYIPTAMGGGTGQSFAIIAVVQNLDQNGQVMLIAGANAEGTGAAGKFVTDLSRLSSVLQNCGISRSGPQSHFELLLQVDTMAGSSNNINLVACHALSANSAH